MIFLWVGDPDWYPVSLCLCRATHSPTPQYLDRSLSCCLIYPQGTHYPDSSSGHAPASLKYTVLTHIMGNAVNVLLTVAATFSHCGPPLDTQSACLSPLKTCICHVAQQPITSIEDPHTPIQWCECTITLGHKLILWYISSTSMPAGERLHPAPDHGNLLALQGLVSLISLCGNCDARHRPCSDYYE